ncbi:MAG: nitroreductase family protein [Candidatus Hodarchaeales archaeon]|jgi:nitroreductase
MDLKGDIKAVIDAIRLRRSIREFTGEKIPTEDIELILDSARYAPSPENIQQFRMVVVRDSQETKEMLARHSVKIAEFVFGMAPYETTGGRLFFLPDKNRPAVYERVKDGDLFSYPAKADTSIIVCATESFHDAHIKYDNEFFGSVVAGMAIQNMWLTTHALGYGAGYMALPFYEPRVSEIVCDALGIPRSWTPLSVLCIGIPVARRMLGPSRFPLEGMAYAERWGNPYKRKAFKSDGE